MNFIIDKEKALKKWILPEQHRILVEDGKKREWMREYAKSHGAQKMANTYAKKEVKRIYSDIDPFGEEDWEN